MLKIFILLLGQQEVSNVEDGGEEVCHYLCFKASTLSTP